jgi:Recombinase/Recombinase zinc beta ribbon domain
MVSTAIASKIPPDRASRDPAVSGEAVGRARSLEPRILRRAREPRIDERKQQRAKQKEERHARGLAADRLLVPIPKSLVEPLVLSAPEFGEWGRDLALIRLPDLVARDIRKVKAFYNVDRRRPSSGERPQYESGVWAVLGAPGEQSEFGEREAVLKISLFASVVASAQIRYGFDYVDLSYIHEDRPDLPRSYGGISGSGLWRLPISRAESAAIVWNGEMHLEGVAFYQNNLETKRIEVDPDREPLVAKLFEWYARGNVSLKEVTTRAFGAGLNHPRSGRRMTKSEIHRMLRNPIYYGDFLWKGTLYRGSHEPLISKELFDAVQAVFDQANRPRYGKHQHAFMGLLTCGRCGCAITGEVQKGRYVYYHCTGFRGRCGNTYVRDEELSRLFEDVVRRVQIPVEIADWIADALRESQDDKERFHRTAVMHLQQQYLSVQSKLDRAYEDRLAGQDHGRVVGQEVGEAIRRETGRHEKASHDYSVTGSKILELAKNAHNLFIRQNSREQSRLLKTLLSNCTFDRGSLSATYTKPFDLLVRATKTEIGWEAGIRTPITWSRATCPTVERPPNRRLRPARGAGGKSAEGRPPSASERGWGPAST